MRTAKVLACCLLVFPLVGTVPKSALNAVPAGRPDLRRRAPLEALLLEGRELVKAGRHRDAEKRFEILSKSALQQNEYRLAARGIGNAGACQFALHRYQEAVRSFLEAHRLAEKAGDRSGAAIFEANLASLYSEMGELDAAVHWTERSLRRMEGKDRGEHLGTLLIQMASLRARQGRMPEAKDLFRQSIEMADRGRDFSLYAVGWNRLGEELMRHGEFREAEGAFLEAFSVRSLRHLPLEGSYANLGKVRLRLGDLRGASTLLDRAVEVSTGLPSVPARDVYRSRGQVRLRQSRFEEALADLRIAVNLERAWRRSVPAADAARVGAEGVLAEVHGALIEAGNRLYLRNGNPALIRETFETAEENRAYSLRSLINRRRERDENLPAAYAEAVAKLERVEVAALRERNAQTEEAAKAAHAELVRLEADLAPDGPAPAEKLLDEVQSGLDRDSALLSFHLGDSVSWLWAVDRAGLALCALPGQAEIEGQVAAASKAIREDAAEAQAAGAKLYGTLFGSLAPRFQQKKRWLLALDTALFNAPVAALADATAGHPAFVAERHTTQVIPGAGAWLEAQRRPPPHSELFVGVGDPIYNTADPRLSQRMPESVSTALLQLPRLVGSGAEIESSARSWNGEHVLLRGGDVSRIRLTEELRRNPAVIHLATHFLESADGTASAMIPLGLAGGDDTELLAALEISHWRIRAGLVVLSGCHSAAGAALRGTGLMGLTRAWLSAGARSVVGSRWATPDEEGVLFRAFYRDLRATGRGDPAEALRAAQLEMLRAGGWRGRPKYWGAYFVVGNQ